MNGGQTVQSSEPNTGLKLRPGLPRRGLRSAAELAQGKPHGTRIRYYAGCRCDGCRAANTEYERQRQAARKRGEGNGLVSAARARAHIQALSRQGIGWRTVADAAKVSFGTVSEVLYGKRLQIRAMNERRILAVNESCAPDGAYIDAGPTWVLLDDLLACGYTRRRVGSEMMGHLVNALQISRQRVTVRNAAQARKVWERLRHAGQAETLRALEQLQELSEEGYHRLRVRRELDAMAEQLELERPTLKVRDGRMRALDVDLVGRVHAKLCGEV